MKSAKKPNNLDAANSSKKQVLDKPKVKIYTSNTETSFDRSYDPA